MEVSTDSEFNVIQFEKKLTQLKDTQEGIQAMSAWCLQHRQHHKKIVNSWLSVLKRVKVEHRLALFYLANDVIQYSKRKNYEFVDSWGTTLQKATTMVRDEKVKHRILRIFQIWEQRAVYGEDFLGDLSGLLSAAAGKVRTDDPTEFQCHALISKLRQCAGLETDTDKKLKLLTDKPLADSDVLVAMLKDRRHVMDVEHEIQDNLVRVEGYVGALQAELRARGHLIAALEHAQLFYSTQRGEVKVVANAYRNFGNRVKGLKRKLDEIIPTLQSPVPSPDINAPSPSPDSDMDLPGDATDYSGGDHSMYSVEQSYSEGMPNGFPSFMEGGMSMPFDIGDSLFGGESPKSPTPDKELESGGGKPIEVINLRPKSEENFNITDFLKSLIPSGRSNELSSMEEYQSEQMDSSHAAGGPSNTYSSSVAPLLPPPMPPVLDNTETYDSYQEPQWVNNSWHIEAPTPIETPESPPCYEQESAIKPVEYNDRTILSVGSGIDIDNRVIPMPPLPVSVPITLGQDMDHRKDIDHRNLISLTGSPGQRQSPPATSNTLPPPPAPPVWAEDQDYRESEVDRDYRTPALSSHSTVRHMHPSLVANIPEPPHIPHVTPKQNNRPSHMNILRTSPGPTSHHMNIPRTSPGPTSHHMNIPRTSPGPTSHHMNIPRTSPGPPPMHVPRSSPGQPPLRLNGSSIRTINPPHFNRPPPPPPPPLYPHYKHFLSPSRPLNPFDKDSTMINNNEPPKDTVMSSNNTEVQLTLPRKINMIINKNDKRFASTLKAVQKEPANKKGSETVASNVETVDMEMSDEDDILENGPNRKMEMATEIEIVAEEVVTASEPPEEMVERISPPDVIGSNVRVPLLPTPVQNAENHLNPLENQSEQQVNNLNPPEIQVNQLDDNLIVPLNHINQLQPDDNLNQPMNNFNLPHFLNRPDNHLNRPDNFSRDSEDPFIGHLRPSEEPNARWNPPNARSQKIPTIMPNLQPLRPPRNDLLNVNNPNHPNHMSLEQHKNPGNSGLRDPPLHRPNDFMTPMHEEWSDNPPGPPRPMGPPLRDEWDKGPLRPMRPPMDDEWHEGPLGPIGPQMHEEWEGPPRPMGPPFPYRGRGGGLPPLIKNRGGHGGSFNNNFRGRGGPMHGQGHFPRRGRGFRGNFRGHW